MNKMTREEAIKVLTVIKDNKEFIQGFFTKPNNDIEAIDMAIESLQFVEHFDLLKEFQSLQEVVRCENCRHWYKKMNKCNRCPSISGNWGANDFCSYGERRDKCD